ncbi:MAG: hypothetical protein GY711_30665, partial [bacterium]|nr:hypothetical protein [bacterium]
LLALCGHLTLEALARIDRLLETRLEVRDPALQLLNDAENLRLSSASNGSCRRRVFEPLTEPPEECRRGAGGFEPPAFCEPEWSVRTSYAYRGAALLADYSAGDVRHYHLDHLGSVRQITNGERDVVASYDYLPYGEEAESRYNPLQFTGHERDSHLAGGADDLDYM